MGCGKQEPLPQLGQVKDFELTAHNGQSFGAKSLDGKIWVANFIFTTCNGPCPRMSTLMKRLQGSVKGDDVKLVSFTVDPDNDTVPALAAYAKTYSAEDGRWYFLTGAKDALNTIAFDSFKLSKVTGGLEHSTRMTLVDAKGRIRGYYTTEEDDPVERLLKDIDRLRDEKG